VALFAITFSLRRPEASLPNQTRVYQKLLPGEKDVQKIVRLTITNIRISLVQLVQQITVIFFMAYFVTGYPL
jgi:hypothetical protein